jgi:hypothetical protein
MIHPERFKRVDVLEEIQEAELLRVGFKNTPDNRGFAGMGPRCCGIIDYSRCYPLEAIEK